MAKKSWEQAIEVLEKSPFSQAAFEQIVQAMHEDLCRVARAQGAIAEDAEEVVQDVWMRTSRALADGAVRNIRALPGFLALSVKREAWKCVSRMRRQQQRVRSLDVQNEQGETQEPVAPLSVEQSVLARAAARQASAVLAPLATKGARALALRSQGLSYDEIAAQMKLPLGTVKTVIHRCRKQLEAARG